MFYGQVEGDTMTVDATRTTRRWYWTNQIGIAAEGTEVLIPGSGATG